MQKSLLLIAHGSRREASNTEIRELADRLKQAGGDRYAHIECAFLELATPSIPDGIQGLIDQGASSITVLPYFLAAGNHVMKDIPEQVDIKRFEHPNANIEIAPYLGTANDIPALLLSLAEKSNEETP